MIKKPLFLAAAAAACAASAAFAGGCQNGAVAREHACSGATALTTSTALRGSSLPMKTIALTFDDGPGARTAELSGYLRDQGIHAAFFVNGMRVTNDTVLQEIVADGHVIGNHTQTHRSLTGRSTTGVRLPDADALAEIAETDAIIAPFVPNGRFMFRPPYGDFDAETASNVDGSPMKKYLGPIDWDIGDHMGPEQATDWDCWQPGSDAKVLTVTQCGDLYLQEIENVGHGIVLMHDPYFIDDDPAKGGTVDMIKYLVPKLVAKGFSFARVDDVPEIAAALPPLDSNPSGASSGSNASSTGGASGSSSNPSRQNAANGSASGDKPDPCPPSPQARAANASESVGFATR